MMMQQGGMMPQGDMSGQMGQQQQPAAPQAMREDQIANAVKFLQHEKVANATREQKSAFLAKKGMTEEEITEAFKRSEQVQAPAPAAAAAAPQAPPAPAAPVQSVPPPQMPQPAYPQYAQPPPYQAYPQYYAPPPPVRARETFWSFISTFLLPILAALGASSALYALLKKFFPRFSILGEEGPSSHNTHQRALPAPSTLAGTPRVSYEDGNTIAASSVRNGNNLVSEQIEEQLRDVKLECKRLQNTSDDLVKSLSKADTENAELKTKVKSIMEKSEKKPTLDLAPASINALASLLSKSVKEQGGVGSTPTTHVGGTMGGTHPMAMSAPAAVLGGDQQGQIIQPDPSMSQQQQQAPGAMSGDLGEAVCRVVQQSASAQAAEKLLKTLALIFSNLLMHPEVDKYRKLNRTSPRFQNLNQFLPGSSEEKLLVLVGFEESGNSFVFQSNDLIPVQAVKQFIDDALKNVEAIFDRPPLAAPMPVPSPPPAAEIIQPPVQEQTVERTPRQMEPAGTPQVHVVSNSSTIEENPPPVGTSVGESVVAGAEEALAPTPQKQGGAPLPWMSSTLQKSNKIHGKPEDESQDPEATQS